MVEHRIAKEDGGALPAWPTSGLTRVPYWAFQREDVYAAEQARIFRGPSWSYLCL
ncbi:MAG: anthranilate 1,2-dioxygenase large subunit, partial [Actinomycetota bacterium]|nr:anthranilate 1,2-dioxygenase large subunit [Actinomycetota bacterium]